MKSKRSSIRLEIGVVTFLTLLFTILKLTGVIGWSWIWVLTPLWISVLFSLAIMLYFGGIGLLLLLVVFSNWLRKQK